MRIFGIKSYLYTTAVIIVFGLFVSLARLYTSFNLVRVVLLLFMFNNIWFIFSNFTKLKFRLFSVVMISLVFIALTKGLLVNDFSDRVILDTYKPLSFILIYQLFSSIDISLVKDKLQLIVQKLSVLFYKTSIFFGFTSFGMLLLLGGYPGMRLPAILPAAYYAAYNKKGRLIMIILAILLSGKRAVLLAIIPALIIGFNIKFTVKKVAIVLLFGIVGYFFINANWETLKQTKGVSKFTYTIDKITKYRETNDIRVLNNVSGKRLQEITSSLYDFDFTDYVFGGGSGYTYNLYDIRREELIKVKYANVHFSPISLLTQYGIIFMILFYGFLFRSCFLGFKYSKLSGSKFLLILSILLIGFIIESLFSFVLFVLPLLPITLGLMHSEIKYLKSQE
ncbi:hypothetical protein [Lacinutrix mariniflava]|uniref:hypothetical protein n=1 Tax=Lacinutrix mariniflava TaxID=342955 RepID=UPI0006E37967|nr:hypothetical protein [Lacinutrix mariniflava]